jgi:aspartyl aminopeptidase
MYEPIERVKMSNKDQAKELEERLSYKRKNFWKIASEDEKKNAFDFAKSYKDLLNKGKTERHVVKVAEHILSKNGFVPLDKDTPQDKKKLFRTNRGKNIIAVHFGNLDIRSGVNLIVSHIDSPRIDLKQVPLFEDKNAKLAMLHTHYYGGIKKYQWMVIPLAIMGVVIKEDGEVVEISIGNKPDDPVFTFTDIAPHLAKDQLKKKLDEAIDADKLRLIFGSIPYPEGEEDEIKLYCLSLLEKKYGIKEEDFISAELTIVPAFSARDVGIDRSMIGSYGHDDRICAYSSLRGFLDMDRNERTAIVFLTDKEEVGSTSNTGVTSQFYINFIADLIDFAGYDSSKLLREVLSNSTVLSADVNVALNPVFPELHEKQNAALLGYGVCVTKFTGSAGKRGANDASAELVARIRALFNSHHICWQTGEIGKVDVGGGGTVAKFVAEYNADVIDCGPPVLSMHSPFEVASKADLYSTYLAYKAFFEKYR